MGIKDNAAGLFETSFILDIFSKNKPQAVSEFHRCMQAFSKETCLDDPILARLSDGEATRIMVEIMGSQNFSILHTMLKSDRDIILSNFKAVRGISLRQIARITGLGYQTVNRA